MASKEHIKLLKKGVNVWNCWRATKLEVKPDLTGADLSDADLRGVDLSGADLSSANLRGAILAFANLKGAILVSANLNRANLSAANLSRANLTEVALSRARLDRANLSEAYLNGAELVRTDFSRANLSKANLSGADFFEANLTDANLREANLSDALLEQASLVRANIANANLSGASVYGASVWGLKLNEGTTQLNLFITPKDEPQITVDNIEVAQFVYLLLHNEKIRDAIDTIGKKGVLLLGRFTEGRIKILERLRDELRKRDFLPIVFNFDKPETKSFTETVRLLASLSRFVIADVTNPRSAPLELQATVPECMIPFVPILDGNEELKPFSMLQDLQQNHPDRVSPVIRYSSVDRLVEVMDAEIIAPANEIHNRLLARKAEQLRIKDV